MADGSSRIRGGQARHLVRVRRVDCADDAGVVRGEGVVSGVVCGGRKGVRGSGFFRFFVVGIGVCLGGFGGRRGWLGGGVWGWDGRVMGSFVLGVRGEDLGGGGEVASDAQAAELGERGGW